MSFLRSIIADAGPARPLHEHSNSQPTITGLKTRRFDGDISGGEEKFPEIVNHPGSLSTSLSVHNGAGDFNLGHAPTFPADKPGIQNRKSKIDLQSALSLPVDKPGPVFDEESVSHMESGNLAPDQQEGSKEKEVFKTKAGLIRQPVGKLVADSMMDSAVSQSHDLSVAVAEKHGAQGRAPGPEELEPVISPANNRETFTVQLDATHTNVLTPPESSFQIKSGKLEAPLETSVSVSDALGKPVPDSATGRSEAEDSFQEETTRTQKPDEAKGGLHDNQPVSRQAMARDSRIPSDMEPASVLPSAARKVSTSASSPVSGSAKPNSHVQHVTGLARPLAGPSSSPESPASVPARPFQTSLIAKHGDPFYSMPALRSAEKKHEAPKVQIGQIDVIVEAATQPAAKPATVSPPVDLASRHYLRRL